MATMGYPNEFIGWIKALYSIVELCPLNGSTFVGSIWDVQSVRQGCPLSVHLFALYIEPLLCRLATDVKGVNVFGHQVAVRAFVDDLVIFSSSDSDTMRSGEIINEYCHWTKAKINRAKSKALGLGAWRDRVAWPLPWLESTPTLRLLGVRFSASIKEAAEWECVNMIKRLRATLSGSYKRQFTLYGRVFYIKTSVLSQAVHLAHVLPCCEAVADDLLSAFTNFIWKGHVEKPNRQTTYRPLNQGGLGVPNPFLFFQSLFVTTLCTKFIGPEGAEKSMLRFWLSFPLRTSFPVFSRNEPTAYIHFPCYTANIVPVVKTLVSLGLFTLEKAPKHKTTYGALVNPLLGPGRAEIANPGLDWAGIWSWVASLKGHERETVHLFNLNLLPTRARLKRLNLVPSSKCPYCTSEVEETDIHFMIECQDRREVISWLETKIRTLGCTDSLLNVIRGDVAHVGNRREVRKIVAKFLHTSWETRGTETPCSRLWRLMLE